MSDIVFKDCEYRYVEEDGTLCCIGEDEPEQWLDGKMMKSSFFEKKIRNDYFLAKRGGIL